MEGELASAPRASTLLRRDVPTCSLTDQIGDIKKSVEQTDWDLCVVVNNERIVLGLLSGEALQGDSLAEVKTRVEDVMQPGPPTIRPDLLPEDALEYMRKRSTILVTTSDGELLGLLRREDAEQAVSRAG